MLRNTGVAMAVAAHRARLGSASANATPHQPVPGNRCLSAPARPFLYEGTFAHEYQHLLESYEDADESSWVNEGISDWAQTLVGYIDTMYQLRDLGVL